MKWTVVTAGTKSYRPWIEQKREACERFGYDFICYDLGGLGFGEPMQVELIRPGGPRSPFKPQLILKALPQVDQWGGVAWLDGDTELLKPLPEIVTAIAVAIHETGQDDTERGYPEGFAINAGVVLFSQVVDTLWFCREWQKKLDKTPSGSDQDALNGLVVHQGMHFQNPICWVSEECIHTLFLGLLPARIYNNRERTDQDTVIRHYEGPKKRDLEVLEAARVG